MGIKDLFKKEEAIVRELRMLPRVTKKRILENVTRRRNQIIEEELLKRQLKGLQPEEKPKKERLKKFRQGLAARREDLREQGIIQPVVRYNKENFQSPLEVASKKARINEIKRLEEQRNKLKSGFKKNETFKIKKSKLKTPRDRLKDGIL
jgi:hypothetical protein